jgi:hypothetical protein
MRHGENCEWKQLESRFDCLSDTQRDKINFFLWQIYKIEFSDNNENSQAQYNARQY